MNRPWLFLMILVAACGSGSGPSEQDVINQIGTSYCTVLQHCYASAFQEGYPAGPSECVEQFARGLSQKQLDGTWPCAQSQIDECLNNISSLRCGPTLDATPVPPACTCTQM